MDLEEKLKKRLAKSSQDIIDNNINIINKYNLNITIRNFDQDGLIFRDENNSLVRILSGELRDSSIYIANPNADVVIIFCDGLLAGWIDASKLEDLGDRFSINRQSLNQMPDNFRFVQNCGHLSDHGGFYDGEFWECAGCGQRLVFNDKVSV